MSQFVKRFNLSTGTAGRRVRPAIWATGVVVQAWACGLLSGCAMLESSASSTSQSTPLSWLTNWVSQPVEIAPGFDIESIKPDAGPAAVAPGNLLEITVWDLYEPGQPYTFPVRVSDRQMVEIPFLGEIPVAGQTVPQIETLLAARFREGEYLLNPRVLVRSLDPPLVKVQVNGAVNRNGFVELTRTDPSIYAAIVSAGGLKKGSGTRVAVTRRTAATLATAIGQANDRNDGPARPVIRESSASSLPDDPHAAAGRANSVDELSVPAKPPAIRPSVPGQAGSTPDIRSVSRGAVEPFHHPDDATVWYDASLAPDREQLKTLRLEEGDTVTVRVTATLRVGGFVNRPGAYSPAGKGSLNVWQAIELAGGVRDQSIPLNITLARPASEGRAAQRSYLHVAAYQDHPFEAPRVEPGDVLHVEPTAGSKIKRAVGDFWNKP